MWCWGQFKSWAVTTILLVHGYVMILMHLPHQAPPPPWPGGRARLPTLMWFSSFSGCSHACATGPATGEGGDAHVIPYMLNNNQMCRLWNVNHEAYDHVPTPLKWAWRVIGLTLHQEPMVFLMIRNAWQHGRNVGCICESWRSIWQMGRCRTMKCVSARDGNWSDKKDWQHPAAFYGFTPCSREGGYRLFKCESHINYTSQQKLLARPRQQ